MAQFLKEEVKKKIKSSAVTLFTENGFNKTSIKMIADHAGVSVGNVYRYYDNKEGLYQAVISGVYMGIKDIMIAVEDGENYQQVFSVNRDDVDVRQPLVHFMNLYRREQKVFDMLLNGERDAHYEKTVKFFIDLLSDYFIRFWGAASHENGISNVEASALTNALIFGVIDLLNRSSEEEREELLVLFIDRLILGYFHMRHLSDEKEGSL